MKRIFFLILVLLATVVNAQSPTALRLLDPHPHEIFGNPIEPNAYAGWQVNYPLYPHGDNFSQAFGFAGLFTLSFTEFNLGRTWYLLTYGNIGLPNFNHVSVFNNTVSDNEGLNVGLQFYSIWGKIYQKALTTSLIAGTKVNTFGGTQIVSYRFGFALEGSISGNGLPVVVNLTPTYILLDDKKEFASIQSEPVGRGVWTADGYIVIPVGTKLGLLIKSTFAENAKPLYRAGIIVATGL